MRKPPFPAPPGKKWIFRAKYTHRSGKVMIAAHYGRKAWCFLVSA